MNVAPDDLLATYADRVYDSEDDNHRDLECVVAKLPVRRWEGDGAA